LKHAGYDVVAITDHNYYTVPKRIPKDLLYIDGIEWWHNYYRMEIIGLGFSSLECMLNDATVGWIPHPKYVRRSIQFIAKVMETNENIFGCELYNDGELQLDVDELEYLSRYDINYYAVDDLHVASQLMRSWIEMEVDSVDKDTVLENLKSGDFWLVLKR